MFESAIPGGAVCDGAISKPFLRPPAHTASAAKAAIVKAVKPRMVGHPGKP